MSRLEDLGLAEVEDEDEEYGDDFEDTLTATAEQVLARARQRRQTDGAAAVRRPAMRCVQCAFPCGRGVPGEPRCSLSSRRACYYVLRCCRSGARSLRRVACLLRSLFPRTCHVNPLDSCAAVLSCRAVAVRRLQRSRRTHRAQHEYSQW
jgi:hypothetical protein